LRLCFVIEKDIRHPFTHAFLIDALNPGIKTNLYIWNEYMLMYLIPKTVAMCYCAICQVRKLPIKDDTTFYLAVEGGVIS
jgi:hypothetical protein